MIEDAYKHAILVLGACAKKTGFYASGLPGGYEATWARDSMITSLGASLIGEKFKEPFRRSLELLAKQQSPLGNIPNAVGSYNTERQSDITFNSIDAPLWYIIGHHAYKNAYGEASLIKKYRKSIDAAKLWLRYQDPNEDGLIVQQPTGDWQDAFPHKYGRVLSTQALHYLALKLDGDTKRAEHIKKIVNGETEKYLAMYEPRLGYYLPWRWKAHNEFKEQGYWFDTFGNLMAILSGLATPKIAKSILAHIEKQEIDKPFPCKAIYPPLKRGSRDWQDYFEDCEAREPFHYLNAGVWPFTGGFYVAALVKTGRVAKAQQALLKLAEANKHYTKEREALKTLIRATSKSGDIKDLWGFQEWLDGKNGEPIGGSNPYQAWSAGMYVFGYKCIEKKNVPFFSFN